MKLNPAGLSGELEQLSLLQMQAGLCALRAAWNEAIETEKSKLSVAALVQAARGASSGFPACEAGRAVVTVAKKATVKTNEAFILDALEADNEGCEYLERMKD